MSYQYLFLHKSHPDKSLTAIPKPAADLMEPDNTICPMQLNWVVHIKDSKKRIGKGK